jgi:arylsulfatase
LEGYLAASQPEKLEELKQLFSTEAAQHHLLPIDDRTVERTNPELAGRPDLMGGRTTLTLYEGMQGMLENSFINVKNRSLSVTAEIEIPEGGASGCIVVQGGRFGGWSLHMRDGKPAYEYNWLGLERYVVESPQVLPKGKSNVTLDFVYDGRGAGKGGVARLSVNGKLVADGRIAKTQANIFSADETADVGLDNQTPVARGVGYGPEETKFTGKIHKVVIDLK